MTTLNEVLELFRLGNLGGAEAGCRAILAGKPDSIDALNMLGSIKLQQQAPADALAASERALALAADNISALNTRATALFRMNRLAESLADYDRALELAANGIEALIGRGTVLACLGRADDAVATFDRIPVARNPADLYRRANLQHSLGLLVAATRDYRRLIEIVPRALPGWIGLLNCAMESCDWAALAQPRQKVLAAVDAGEPVDPFLMLRVSTDPAQLLKGAKAVAPRAVSAPALRVRARPERLTLAYVSPDYRIHPLAYLIPELLELHDRSRFEVIGVSVGPPDDSAIRSRIVAAFDRFHDMQARPDEDAVSLLRSLDIDVAVDLAVCTQYSRPGVFARRFAPVQASYLGFCGTSGSSFIDYLIADRIVVPPQEQRFFTEKIAYLPDSFMVADSAQPVSERTPSRREAGLPDDGFVFCCFNKSFKFTQPVFDVWMRLLRSVEGSVLWLSDKHGRDSENLRRHAAEQGIDPQRLVFAPNLPARANHFARHRLADLFLDTLPFNAHTTACDALFAGLPVLTVKGPTFVGRVAASMLHAVGLGELVTQNLAEYEALALALARDPARMRDIRAQLAVNRRTHALFDTARFARNIEAAYDRMFDIWSRGEPPRSFDVADA